MLGQNVLLKNSGKDFLYHEETTKKKKINGSPMFLEKHE